MDTVSLAGVALLIAFVAVFAVVVVSYMSSLVKNAYQIKIEIRSEMEDGLRRMSDDSEKWVRMTKRDLLDEVARARVILENENTRHFSELAEAMKKQLGDLEETAKRDRAKLAVVQEETRVRLDDMRARIGEVEHIYRAIARPAKKTDKEKPEAPLTSDLDPAKPKTPSEAPEKGVKDVKDAKEEKAG